MIYLDNSATGMPKHKDCIGAIATALTECGNSGRSAYPAADRAAETLFSARSALAVLFGAKEENVVLTTGATHALNIAIRGMAVGGEILISNLEHNAVLRTAYSAFRSVAIFDVDLHDDEATVRNFVRMLSPRTALVCVTHASNVCGRILPVRALADEAHARGIPFVLDAAQTAGHFALTLADTGADAICLSCHKGIYAPTGTGAILLSESAPLPSPLLTGGTGGSSRSRSMPSFLPDRLEAGTQNIAMAAAVAAACKGLKYPKNDHAVLDYLLSALRADGRYILYGEPEGNSEKYLPIIAFNMRGTDSETLCERLAERGLCLRGGYHCAPLAHRALKTPEGGCARISIGRHTTLSEAETAARILCGAV